MLLVQVKARSVGNPLVHLQNYPKQTRPLGHKGKPLSPIWWRRNMIIQVKRVIV